MSMKDKHYALLAEVGYANTGIANVLDEEALRPV